MCTLFETGDRNGAVEYGTWTRMRVGALDPSSIAPSPSSSRLQLSLSHASSARHRGSSSPDGWPSKRNWHDTEAAAILVADDNSMLMLPGGLVSHPSGDGIGAATAISNPLHSPRSCAWRRRLEVLARSSDTTGGRTHLDVVPLQAAGPVDWTCCLWN